MPEYEIVLTFPGSYDDDASAFEHGDFIAQAAEHRDPSIEVSVAVREVSP